MHQTRPQKHRDEYRVPRRFSIAEILAMMTVFGFLFGGLRWFQASAALYLFLGTQGVIICLVQMKFGTVPRGGSMLVGCIFMPACLGALSAFGSSAVPPDFEGALFVPKAILFGGLLGYCTGALAAGVFLVLDIFQGALRRAHKRFLTGSTRPTRS